MEVSHFEKSLINNPDTQRNKTEKVKPGDGKCYELPLWMGRDSSVGIITRYGLDGPGIESRWGDEIFRTCPDRP
jgi:hypothetical protein